MPRAFTNQIESNLGNVYDHIKISPVCNEASGDINTNLTEKKSAALNE